MFSSTVTLVAVVLVGMVLVTDLADAYSSYSRSRYPSRSSSSSFYRRYGSGTRYSSPKARYVHSFGSRSNHPHPHPPQAVGVPIMVDYDDLDDSDIANRILPYGYGDSLLLPIEGLLRDLAGYTGYKQASVPGIVRNIKHEFYIGANKRDPYLHNILKRYGFMFTGNPSDLGMGMGGQQGGLDNILGSVLGGNGGAGGMYSNGGGLGVSSAQNPLPGVGLGGINDDLFDDFGNGLLASSNTAASKQENTMGNNPIDPLGSNIAAAWGALTHLGVDGYMERARRLMDITDRLKEAIGGIQGLKIMGNPHMTCFAIGSDDPEVDVLVVADLMEKKGWVMERQQNPTCLHCSIMPHHNNSCDTLIQDLKQCTQDAKGKKELSKQGTAGIYGMMATIPDATIVEDFVKEFFSQVYKIQ